MSKKLEELREKITALRAKVNEKFEAAGPDLDMNADAVAAVNKMNDELTALAKEETALAALEQMRDENVAAQNAQSQIVRPAIHMPTGAKASTTEPNKTLGEMFIGSPAYLQRESGGPGPSAMLDLGVGEIKAALFETAAGWAPESMRTGVVVDMATRPLQVTDLIPTASTSQAAVVYMEETISTSAAAERAEGGAYPASALALTQRTATVRSIGTSLPVTDEQLEDVAQAQSYIDGRLGFFVQQRMDGQIVNGNGIAPNLTGILAATGLQTQAKGADPVPDAVYKAMTKVRVMGRAFPSAAIFHPNDWQDIRLLRTADGVYIWGSPAEVGPEMIWGLRVVQSDAIAENTGLVGDFSPAMLALYIRRGLEVQVGYVNTDFTTGRQTVRAGIRAALVVYRGAAFSTVTGI